MAPTPLAVHVLYAQLLKIATIKGSGAAKMKGDIVKRLLVQTKGEEVRYLVRTLVRHLRIGAVRLVSRASSRLCHLMLEADPDSPLRLSFRLWQGLSSSVVRREARL